MQKDVQLSMITFVLDYNYYTIMSIVVVVVVGGAVVVVVPIQYYFRLFYFPLNPGRNVSLSLKNKLLLVYTMHRILNRISIQKQKLIVISMRYNRSYYHEYLIVNT